MPETIEETVSLPSEFLIEAAAQLYAVANFLTALWGDQDGGEGNIADRVSGPASELLGEAFGDTWSHEGGVMMLAEARAKTIVALWLRDIGGDDA